MHSYTGAEVGCGNFIVYKLTLDNKEFVSIAFNSATVQWVDSQSFAVGKADVLEIKRKVYAGEIHQSLCNDIMMEKPEKLIEEVATSGIVEVLTSENERAKANKKEPYKVTIILKNVTFSEITIDYLRIENIHVGWLPG